jgi:AcrR family transcriptional regulator
VILQNEDNKGGIEEMTVDLTEQTSHKHKKQDKKQAIVEAARELFTTEGYETTTIAHVAKKAGVAVGTVYLYFKNKSELLLGVKGDWEIEFLATMANPELQTIPHHMRARPLIQSCFELCGRQTEMIQMMGVQPQEVGDWGPKVPGLIQQALEVFFTEGIADGSFRNVDAHAAAIIAFGMVQGSLHQCFLAEGGAEPARYVEALVDAMEKWLANPELNK